MNQAKRRAYFKKRSLAMQKEILAIYPGDDTTWWGSGFVLQFQPDGKGYFQGTVRVSNHKGDRRRRFNTASLADQKQLLAEHPEDDKVWWGGLRPKRGGVKNWSLELCADGRSVWVGSEKRMEYLHPRITQATHRSVFNRATLSNQKATLASHAGTDQDWWGQEWTIVFDKAGRGRWEKQAPIADEKELERKRAIQAQKSKALQGAKDHRAGVHKLDIAAQELALQNHGEGDTEWWGTGYTLGYAQDGSWRGQWFRSSLSDKPDTVNQRQRTHRRKFNLATLNQKELLMKHDENDEEWWGKGWILVQGDDGRYKFEQKK